jgi:ABC-2 type transport system permease protein
VITVTTLDPAAVVPSSPAVEPLHPAVASLRRIFAVASRHLYVTVRNPPRLFDMAVWPVVDTVLYGSIARYMQQQGASASGSGRTALAVVTGIIMWHVRLSRPRSRSPPGFNEETWSRHLPSLLTTPLRPFEWLIGTALQGW